MIIYTNALFVKTKKQTKSSRFYHYYYYYNIKRIIKIFILKIQELTQI